MEIREPDRTEDRIKRSKWYGNEEVILDVGKLIRCKDCKRSSPSAQFCYEWYQPTRPNGYCHKAQEKDGDVE